MPKYRADIDGLRALAILPVLFFHAGFGFAQGGFVGVDVFFVISGFLITSLIHGKMVAGEFSLVEFYERRVRRLLPALFAVLLFCVLLGVLLLLPQDFRYFGGSLFATTLFVSNVFFWLEAGYFDVAAERKPLLHTWSLAVEEQYYLLFPLYLLLVLRYLPRHKVAVTAAITLITLAASEWGVRHAESAAFYLTPLRAWQLGLGALLALAPPPRPRSPALINGLSMAGIGLIAWSVAAYSWETHFPGFNALLPCAGTALLIWTGDSRDSLCGRLLRLRPLVLTGLVSYSLYLWHWPLLVFARHFAIRELTLAERLVVLLLSVVIAIISWRFVERPFRGRRGMFERWTLFRVTAGVMAGLGAIALAIVSLDGWPQRYDVATQQLLAGADDINPRRDECSFLTARELRNGQACRLGRPGGEPPSFFIWGDSHADTVMTVFDRLAREHGQTGLYLGKFGCPPLVGVGRAGSTYECRAFNAAARELIESAPGASVVLVARWSHYTRQPLFGHEERTRVVLFDELSTVRETGLNDEVLVRGLDRTLDALLQRPVYIVTTIPEMPYSVPQALAQARHLGRDLEIRLKMDEYEARQRTVTTIFGAAHARHEFTVLNPAAVLCASGWCRVEQDGHPLYFDDRHLSVRGADFVAAVLQPVFATSSGTGHAR